MRPSTLDLGRVANENPPKLHTMDGKGNRVDLVEFHPAYHAMMAKSIGHGIHASAHDGSDKPGPVSTRAVRLYLATQAESGHMCPITMTHACIGALRSEPALLAKWLPKIQTRTYDPRPLPWWEKNGVTLGMGMTERQGGTDVRANITAAAARRRPCRDHRPQMVHVGADVRRLPRAGPGGRRAHLLSDAALPARRQPGTRSASSA